MGMAKEHAQAVADQKTIDDYGVEFHNLSALTQDLVFQQASEQAQNEIIIIQKRMRHD